MISISAFDLDRTLIRANSSFLFFRYLMQRGSFRLRALFQALFISLEYRFFSLDLHDLHFKIFNAFLKGKKLSSIEDEISRFLEADFYRFFYLPSFSRLRRAQHQGHYTVILSSSPSFIVGPIAKYLGVSLWKSSEYGVDRMGRLESVAKVLSGKEKAEHLADFAHKKSIDSKRITAYSDSALDLPFLLAAGKAVAVNPSNEMRRISKEKGWEII